MMSESESVKTEQSEIDALALSGYLYKKTRDDRWQRRWFETQGFYLTYYKNRRVEKLLAALSLPQVGEIKVIPPSEDPEGNVGLFCLELMSRVYTLRATTNEEAELWVKTLTKLRQQGQNATPLAASGVMDASKDGAASTATQAANISVKGASNDAKWVKGDRSASCCGCFG